MKLAAAFLQHSTVGDILRERVLEAVLWVRKQPRLRDEFGSLKRSSAPRIASSGSSGAARSKENGTCLPTTAATCKRRLSSWESLSIRAASLER